MTTLASLKEELEPHKNELVLDFFEVVRLLDVIDVPGDDFFWVLMSPTKGIYHASCVGGWTVLKGKIDGHAYEMLDRVWNINEPLWGPRWEKYQTESIRLTQIFFSNSEE